MKQNEVEIVSMILQDPATLTFNQMGIFLAKVKQKKAEWWNEWPDGKGCNKDHNVAMIELKKFVTRCPK
jgi:hypothetical protein